MAHVQPHYPVKADSKLITAAMTRCVYDEKLDFDWPVFDTRFLVNPGKNESEVKRATNYDVVQEHCLTWALSCSALRFSIIGNQWLFTKKEMISS